MATLGSWGITIASMLGPKALRCSGAVTEADINEATDAERRQSTIDAGD